MKKHDQINNNHLFKLKHTIKSLFSNNLKLVLIIGISSLFISSRSFSQLSLNIGADQQFCGSGTVNLQSTMNGLILPIGSPVSSYTLNVGAQIPANFSTPNLICGQEYNMTISGVYSAWSDPVTPACSTNCTPIGNACPSLRYFDAEQLNFYGVVTNPPNASRILTPYLNLNPNNAVPDPNHVYNYTFTGTNSPLIIDWAGTQATDDCGSLTYTITSAASNFTYAWSINGGPTFSTLEDPGNYSFTNPGTYVVSCTATNAGTINNNTTCNITAQMTVTVNAIPNVLITGPTSVCAGSSITLTASGASTYLWTAGASGTGPTKTTTPLTNPTSYTVVGTAVNGCSNTNSVLIFVQALPVINITTTASSICSGGSATMTASSSSSPITYSWAGLGLGASKTVSPVATNSTTPFSYTVSGTSNGCTGTATQIINVTPNVSATTLTPSICLGDQVVISATGSTSYTINTVPPTTFTNSVAFNPSVIGSTNYIVTGVNSTCSNTATVNIQVTNCACPPGYITMDQAYVNSLSPTSTITGGKYNIISSISVPSSLYFQDCDFKINSGVSITVGSNKSLQLRDCHFSACSQMWNGIIVALGGDIKVEGVTKPTLIEDAFVAIDFTGGSLNRRMSIENTIFNKNEIGIRVNSFNTNSANYRMVIDNCSFTCRDIPVGASWLSTPLTINGFRTNFGATGGTSLDDQQVVESIYSSTNANAFLKAPYSGKKSSYGIYLNNVGLTTGTGNNPSFVSFNLTSSTPAKYNFFDNQSVGLYLKNSNVNVGRAKFQNSNTQNSLLGALGLGIYCQSTIKTKIFVETNTFTNCHEGIVITDAFTAKVTGNTIKSTQVEVISPLATHIGKYGIVLQSKQYNNIDINSNRMYNIENGILYNCTGLIAGAAYSGAININSNIIQANYPSESYSGAYVRNAIVATNIDAIISSNVANTFLTIKNNTLNQVNNGIEVGGWYKNIITETNTINLKNSLAPAFVHSGIYYYSNSNTTAVPNTIFRNTITGFGSSNTNSFAVKYFTSTNTNIFCNVISNTFKGLSFSGPSFGTVSKRNTLNNHRYGFVLDGTTSIGPQGSMAFPADNEYNGTWVNPNFMTMTMAGATPVGNEMYVNNASPFNPNLSSTNVFPSNIPYSNSSTIPTIIYATGNTQTCPAVQLAQNNNQNGNIINEREHINKHLNGEIPFEVLPLESDYNSKKQIYRLLKSDLDLVNGETSLNDFITLNNESNHGKLERASAQLSNGNPDNALNELLSLESNQIDDNFKSFDETRINYDLYTLNPSDSISLLEIGNKCPLYDGSVVFEARIMYGAIYGLDYQFTDACEIDSTRGEKRLSQNIGDNYDSEILNSEKRDFKTLVYPNPNSGNFFINTDSFNYIQIFDLQGRIVNYSLRNVNANVFEIEIDANNGMYNIQIIHPNSIENVKIQVNK